jgi:phage shock protein A
MSFFSRLSDIVGANAHAVLDACEQPERMTRYAIRGMEEDLARARRQAASAIAVERSLRRELDQARAEVDHWHTQARSALTADREDLARQALQRKEEHAEQVRGLESHYASALATSDKVRADLHKLEMNLTAAQRRQRYLLARYRIAQARLALGRTSPDARAAGRWRDWENRLTDLEATLTAEVDLTDPGEELDHTLAQIERDRRVDAELAGMRQEAKSDKA